MEGKGVLQVAAKVQIKSNVFFWFTRRKREKKKWHFFFQFIPHHDFTVSITMVNSSGWLKIERLLIACSVNTGMLLTLNVSRAVCRTTLSKHQTL